MTFTIRHGAAAALMAGVAVSPSAAQPNGTDWIKLHAGGRYADLTASREQSPRAGRTVDLGVAGSSNEHWGHGGPARAERGRAWRRLSRRHHRWRPDRAADGADCRHPGGALVERPLGHCRAFACGHWFEQTGRARRCRTAPTHYVQVTARFRAASTGKTTLHVGFGGGAMWVRETVRSGHGLTAEKYRWGPHLLAAPTLMAATATLACLMPTLRATSGEPARVLRRE